MSLLSTIASKIGGAVKGLQNATAKVFPAPAKGTPGTVTVGGRTMYLDPMGATGSGAKIAGTVAKPFLSSAASKAKDLVSSAYQNTKNAVSNILGKNQTAAVINAGSKTANVATKVVDDVARATTKPSVAQQALNAIKNNPIKSSAVAIIGGTALYNNVRNAVPQAATGYVAPQGQSGNSGDDRKVDLSNLSGYDRLMAQMAMEKKKKPAQQSTGYGGEAGETMQSFATSPASYASGRTTGFQSMSGNTVAMSGGSNNLGIVGAGGKSGAALIGEPFTGSDTISTINSSTAAGPEPFVPLEALPIGDNISLDDVQKVRDNTKTLLQNSAALSEDDRAAMYKQIDWLTAQGTDKLQKMNMMPPVPVVDTAEQSEYLAQFTDPAELSDVRTAMDNVRTQLGLPALEQQRISVMQQMQSISEAFDTQISSIKNNPDLPKGLAARRLTDLFEQKKGALTTLTSNLEILGQQINDANDLVDREFQISKYEEEQEDKQAKRMQDYLALMIETGAIGGMSEQEIKEWSAATGFSAGGLKKLKEQVLNPEIDPHFEETIDAKNNKVITVLDKNNQIGRAHV